MIPHTDSQKAINPAEFSGLEIIRFAITTIISPQTQQANHNQLRITTVPTLVTVPLG